MTKLLLVQLYSPQSMIGLWLWTIACCLLHPKHGAPAAWMHLLTRLRSVFCTDLKQACLQHRQNMGQETTWTVFWLDQSPERGWNNRVAVDFNQPMTGDPQKCASLCYVCLLGEGGGNCVCVCVSFLLMALPLNLTITIKWFTYTRTHKQKHVSKMHIPWYFNTYWQWYLMFQWDWF